MKKFLVIVAFLVGALSIQAQEQEAVIDSVYIYNVMEKGGELIGRHYQKEGFEEKLIMLCEKYQTDVFIVRVFGKPGPPVTFIVRRNKPKYKQPVKRELLRG